MKITEGFILRKVANENVVMPIGRASAKLNGIIKLNATGVLLWNLLKDGAEKADLAAALVKEYGIEMAQAERDVDAFLAPLVKIGCIE